MQSSRYGSASAGRKKSSAGSSNGSRGGSGVSGGSDGPGGDVLGRFLRSNDVGDGISMKKVELEDDDEDEEEKEAQKSTEPVKTGVHSNPSPILSAMTTLAKDVQIAASNSISLTLQYVYTLREKWALIDPVTLLPAHIPTLNGLISLSATNLRILSARFAVSPDAISDGTTPTVLDNDTEVRLLKNCVESLVEVLEGCKHAVKTYQQNEDRSTSNRTWLPKTEFQSSLQAVNTLLTQYIPVMRAQFEFHVQQKSTEPVVNVSLPKSAPVHRNKTSKPIPTIGTKTAQGKKKSVIVRSQPPAASPSHTSSKQHWRRDGLYIAGLRCLELLASADGNSMLPCWPLFLSDSFKLDRQLETLSSELLSSLQSAEGPLPLIGSQNFPGIPPVSSPSLASSTLQSAILDFSSPVLEVCFSSPNLKLRSQAFQTLAAMLSIPSLVRWLPKRKSESTGLPPIRSSRISASRQSDSFGEKIQKALVKALRVCSLVLCRDERSEVTHMVLQCVTTILNVLPVGNVYSFDFNKMVEVPGLYSHSKELWMFFTLVSRFCVECVIENKVFNEGEELLNKSPAGSKNIYVRFSTRAQKCIGWLQGNCRPSQGEWSTQLFECLSTPQLMKTGIFDAIPLPVSRDVFLWNTPWKLVDGQVTQMVCPVHLIVFLHALCNRNRSTVYTPQLFAVAEGMLRAQLSNQKLADDARFFAELSKVLSVSEIHVERELYCVILGIYFEFQIGSVPQKCEAANIQVDLSGVVCDLLLRLKDPNHNVRYAANVALMGLRDSAWKILAGCPPPPKSSRLAHNLAHVVILALRDSCSDVGLIRSIAYRALGNAICCQVDLPSFDVTFKPTVDLGFCCEGSLGAMWLGFFFEGCRASKLKTRLYAVWSLCCLIKYNLIPARMSSSFASLVRDTIDGSTQCLLQIKSDLNCWKLVLDTVLPMLEDSTKMYTTAIHTMGSVLIAMLPLARVASLRSAILDTSNLVLNVLNSKFLSSLVGISDHKVHVEGEDMAILSKQHSRKLANSVVQTEVYAFVLQSHCCVGGTVQGEYVLALLIQSFRRGSLQLRLWAASALLYIQSSQPITSDSLAEVTPMLTVEQLLRILESVFITLERDATVDCFSTSAKMLSSFSTGLPSHVALSPSHVMPCSPNPSLSASSVEETSHQESENLWSRTTKKETTPQELLRSRCSSLRSVCLLLCASILHTLRQQTLSDSLNQRLSESFIYHASGLLTILEQHASVVSFPGVVGNTIVYRGRTLSVLPPYISLSTLASGLPSLKFNPEQFNKIFATQNNNLDSMTHIDKIPMSSLVEKVTTELCGILALSSNLVLPDSLRYRLHSLLPASTEILGLPSRQRGGSADFTILSGGYNVFDGLQTADHSVVKSSKVVSVYIPDNLEESDEF